MDSSRIKKHITAILFKGDKTVIQYSQNFTPAGLEVAITEQPNFKSDLSRHGDFTRAMERMAVHLIVKCGFAEPVDKVGKQIDKPYFDDYLYEDDPRFNDVKVTGVIVTTKKDKTGFQITGEVTTIDDQVFKLKSPVISTIKIDGAYNYPLLVLAEEHLDTLMLEAEEWLKHKSSNPQLKLAV